MPAKWWCPRTIDYERQALLLRAAGSARSAHGAVLRACRGPHPAAARDHARSRLRPVHQLRADARDLPAPSGRARVSRCCSRATAPKNALLEEFRNTPNAVLFATASFWQGVDVQGEQLSCVIIDRLPFAVPSDPVVAARVRAIDTKAATRSSEYQVPSAVITLKQGFGRLIRSLHDRGLLVLLDNRILKKSYGRVFLKVCPITAARPSCGRWKGSSELRVSRRRTPSAADPRWECRFCRGMEKACHALGLGIFWRALRAHWLRGLG